MSFDYRVLAAAYAAGLSAADVADLYGCNKSTVLRATNAYGVTRADAKGGPPRRAECRRGHALTPANTFPATNGGRVCRTCKRDRDRQWWRNRKENR